MKHKRYSFKPSYELCLEVWNAFCSDDSLPHLGRIILSLDKDNKWFISAKAFVFFALPELHFHKLDTLLFSLRLAGIGYHFCYSNIPYDYGI